ncbi:MAG: hypothetical protein ABI355_14755 [Solirubrobacteraceae bacterium]
MSRRLRWILSLGIVLSLAVIPIALAQPTSAAHTSASAGRAPAARAASASATVPQQRGVRRIPHQPSALAPNAVAAPRVSDQRVATSTAPLLASFNGVSSRDSAVTNFGAEFEPPDQGLCSGNGYVVEMVNSAYTIYKPDGTVVTGPYNVNGPFDEGLSEFTSDPRCHYDAATHTWYATILYINADSTQSRVDLAVNTSGDPTKAWTTYRIDTTDVGGSTGPKHTGCPCLGDQPTLGIDASNVYVTTNEFSLQGPQFNGAQIYAIPQNDLVMAGPTATPAHFVHFDNLNVGGAVAASVQPALTTKSAPAEYFLSSLDPNGTFDQRIGVWAMTNAAGIDKGIKPTLSSYVMPSEAYGVPPGAEQKGSSSLLDAGDDRMQQVQYIDGHVWGALDTSVTIPNDPAARAGAAWFKVTPTLSKGVVTGASARQGYVATAGNYVLYPAIQSAPDGKTVMAFSLSSATRFPSAAYAVLDPGATAFGPVTVAAAGTGSYDPTATRWGDYSWAVLDPSGKGVWAATEYIPPAASQTPDGRRNWGTRVYEVATP